MRRGSEAGARYPRAMGRYSVAALPTHCMRKQQKSLDNCRKKGIKSFFQCDKSSRIAPRRRFAPFDCHHDSGSFYGHTFNSGHREDALQRPASKFGSFGRARKALNNPRRPRKRSSTENADWRRFVEGVEALPERSRPLPADFSQQRSWRPIVSVFLENKYVPSYAERRC